MTDEHIIAAAQCSAKTEFGRCRYRAGDHTRHRAKTSFGEMWWDEPVVLLVGTDSPTPAPDNRSESMLRRVDFDTGPEEADTGKGPAAGEWQRPEGGEIASLRAELARVEGVRDDFRHELFLVWRALIQTAGEDVSDDQQPPALELVHRLAAELSRVQKERDDYSAQIKILADVIGEVPGDPATLDDAAAVSIRLIRDGRNLAAELSQVQKERDALKLAAGLTADTVVSFAVGAIRNMLDTAHVARTQLRPQIARLEADLADTRRDLAAAHDRLDANGGIPDRYDDAIRERDEARAALTGEQLTVAEVLAVCQRAEAARDAAESALAALRTEVGKIADEYGREAAQARRRHDATTAATSAARWHLGGAAQVWRDASARLRALVTDQSPRECSTCNGTSVVKCAAHVAGDGCENLSLFCPDCVTDQPSSVPYSETELLRTRFEQAADAWETLAEESRTYADSSIVPAIRSRSEAVARTYQACSNTVRSMLTMSELLPAAPGGYDDQC